MKAAIYSQPGAPEVLRYEDVADPICPPGGVIIRVAAVSIEGGDLINRATSRPPWRGHVLGYAAAGEIIVVGRDVSDRKVGQRVTSFGFDGSHAELRAVAASRTWVVPDALGISEAAAVPIAFGTAYHCLFTRGSLAAGETVLIQAGAGGVGVAAIQLAKRVGARVLATVSGQERVEVLRGLGLDEAIDHRREDVAERVQALTGGRGVDLVVDPVGSTLGVSLASLRPDGRLVFSGNAGGTSIKPDLWPAMQANQSLLGVFMGPLLEQQGPYEAINAMLGDVSKGELRAVIAKSFPLAEAAAAHRYAEEISIVGRVVLTVA